MGIYCTASKSTSTSPRDIDRRDPGGPNLSRTDRRQAGSARVVPLSEENGHLSLLSVRSFAELVAWLRLRLAVAASAGSPSPPTPTAAASTEPRWQPQTPNRGAESQSGPRPTGQPPNGWASVPREAQNSDDPSTRDTPMPT